MERVIALKYGTLIFLKNGDIWELVRGGGKKLFPIPPSYPISQILIQTATNFERLLHLNQNDFQYASGR